VEVGWVGLGRGFGKLGQGRVGGVSVVHVHLGVAKPWMQIFCSRVDGSSSFHHSLTDNAQHDAHSHASTRIITG
jgi:hypothetical protein